MLADETPIKGVRYNVQLLLNGWVLSALLWCFGSGIQFVAGSVLDGWLVRIGLYIEVVGWACGLISAVVFMMLIGIYFTGRRKGKIL
ncbi:hypothetical protein FQ186_25945 [Pseudomonas sp. ANT_H14]|uniref:hypothetical protein n=1 Tax=unclassified Pseudomonas TaxID=196821 RepID=UPI0011EBBD3D|nr:MULTISPECIES: hypothetical protein [unclassified Pseudomonas]KAA0946214.1 hypothetical protein FQ182_13600 [Pseudomonas sp. ANT_H4]KAA0947149.1 hypothetical protein FQ186_25945 [Pseudomonas sp. ANT_H14]